MRVCFQESRVVQNQVESAQNLHTSSNGVRNAQLPQPYVNDDANVIVVEVVLRFWVLDQTPDRLHTLVKAVHAAPNSQVEQLVLIVVLMVKEVLQDHIVIGRCLIKEWEHTHDDRNDGDLCIFVDDVRQGYDQRLQELLGGQFDSLVIEHVHQQNEGVTSEVF